MRRGKKGKRREEAVGAGQHRKKRPKGEGDKGKRRRAEREGAQGEEGREARAGEGRREVDRRGEKYTIRREKFELYEEGTKCIHM